MTGDLFHFSSNQLIGRCGTAPKIQDWKPAGKREKVKKTVDLAAIKLKYYSFEYFDRFPVPVLRREKE
ncbi:MAG: hypothetical protein FVQ81_07140 [Candidatus Glassbacteria bacterium]|nr:hypothetical protein [Candidatus Glassbacteria bacterium]